MQRFGSDYLYAEPYTTFYTSDEEARRWCREARVEELRQRSGYYTARDEDKRGSGIAGLWADDDESRIGADEPVEALPWLDADLQEEIDLLVEYAEEHGVDVSFEVEYLDEKRESWLEDGRTLAQDRAMLSWLRRDDIEIAREKRERRRTAADRFLERNGEVVVKPRVAGDYWGAGPEAEKRWLDAQIAQLRIQYGEFARAARRAGVRHLDRDPQLQAIARQAESLRHRHNFKRYVEALYCDPEQAGKDFAPVYAQVNARRKAAGLPYAAAVEKLGDAVAERNARALMGDGRWIGVEGLIATK